MTPERRQEIRDASLHKTDRTYSAHEWRKMLIEMDIAMLSLEYKVEALEKRGEQA